MQIPAAQVSYRKKIGDLDGDKVFELGTKGGLHLVVVMRKSGKSETLGAGPHPAVARHIATKREPKINMTELSKSDFVEERFYQHLLSKYEEVTESIRQLQGFGNG